MLDVQIKENIFKLIPTTRYQGSKRRILPWIYENIKHLKFESVLDGFGGTASVSYLFKLMGKEITFNDALLSNYQTGVALIENDGIKLNENDINYPTCTVKIPIIERTKYINKLNFNNS